MRHIPAHKNTKNPPGQIKTLADYIVKVEESEKPPPKKLTFDEWWLSEVCDDLCGHVDVNDYRTLKPIFEVVWKAGQENV